MQSSGPNSGAPKAPTPTPDSPGKPTLFLTGLLALALVVIVALLVYPKRPVPPPGGPESDPATPEAVPGRPGMSAGTSPGAGSDASINPATNPPLSLFSTQNVSAAKLAIATMAKMDLSLKQITTDDAADWHAGFQRLVQMGKEAVPEILEFLKTKANVRYDLVSGGQLIGTATLRLALLDALGLIGGEEAVQGMLSTLTGNTSAAEVALIAQNLEHLAPDQYREQTLQAARSVLGLAAAGKLDNDDMGPLYKLLQQQAGAGAVEDFAKYAGNWRYYSTIALAGLPDGAGVASLIQMAQDTSPAARNARSAALQALGNIAADSPQAAALLLEQAKANAIPFPAWMTIAGLLGGQQLQIGKVPAGSEGGNTRTWHLAIGNQNFYSAPPRDGYTPEQINQRLALIDQLMAATANDSVRELLQQARNTLQGGSTSPNK